MEIEGLKKGNLVKIIMKKNSLYKLMKMLNTTVFLLKKVKVNPKHFHSKYNLLLLTHVNVYY